MGELIKVLKSKKTHRVMGDGKRSTAVSRLTQWQCARQWESDPNALGDYFSGRSCIQPVPLINARQASLIQPISAQASHSAKASIRAL